MHIHDRSNLSFHWGLDKRSQTHSCAWVPMEEHSIKILRNLNLILTRLVSKANLFGFDFTDPKQLSYFNLMRYF